MKKLFTVTSMMLIILSTSAQLISDSKRKNAVFVEFGGWAFWYSLNYEHRFSLAENHRLTLGSGLSVMPPTKGAQVLLGISTNYLLGRTHNLEIGITPSVFFDEEKEFYFSPRLGYRYEGPKGFLFRIGTSPSLFTQDVSGLSMLSWAYLSFGYSF